ncbi:MAG: TRAP transporter small permease subunit [Hyphomicrobiaceae bacterium]|nr:TRAP transporter small permease subunit [Hyphomicrobiaceae bacterium]
MKAIVRLIEAITQSAGYLAALVVIPLAVATCYEVFARYLFGAPTIWAFELGYTLMGVHFLLGGALTLQRQSHVRIDLIYANLSPRGRAMIDLLLFGLLVIPCLYLLSERLVVYAMDAYTSGERSGNSAWNPPIWPFRAIIATSFILLLLQVVAECLKAIMTLSGSDPRPSAYAVVEERE